MKNIAQKSLIGLLFACLFATACTNADSNTSTAIKPNTQQQGNYFFISTDAFYEGSMDAVESPGKTFSLMLSPDGKAKMTTDFQNEGQMMVDTGAWKTTPDGNVSLMLFRLGLRDSTQVEFEPDGDKLRYAKGNKPEMDGLALVVKPIPATEK